MDRKLKLIFGALLFSAMATTALCLQGWFEEALVPGVIFFLAAIELLEGERHDKRP